MSCLHERDMSWPWFENRKQGVEKFCSVPISMYSTHAALQTHCSWCHFPSSSPHSRVSPETVGTKHAIEQRARERPSTFEMDHPFVSVWKLLDELLPLFHIKSACRSPSFPESGGEHNDGSDGLGKQTVGTLAHATCVCISNRVDGGEVRCDGKGVSCAGGEPARRLNSLRCQPVLLLLGERARTENGERIETRPEVRVSRFACNWSMRAGGRVAD